VPVPTPTRAARLAVWGTAFLREEAPLDQVVAAVEGSDEPHLVCCGMSAPDEMAETLLDLRAAGVPGLRLALPAPGDLLGLTGPPEVNRAVLAAGEAAVALPTPAADAVPVLVPTVTVFGPPGDQGHCVTWRRLQAAAGLPDVPTLGEADRALRSAMAEATDRLRRLDAAPWGDGSQPAAAARERRGVTMPGSADPRAMAVADQALAVLTLVEVARRDDGGAVSAHTAAARAAVLGPLERAARHALVAACTPSLAPAGR
jgi:hypothetical protein